ncbi:phosphomannomutase/phosphoglucomutase [Sesbania bispinosa]|nr:phosphomannomutase/phosphoglucomutase [Sesbania bispinosa]
MAHGRGEDEGFLVNGSLNVCKLWDKRGTFLEGEILAVCRGETTKKGKGTRVIWEKIKQR